MINGFLGEEPEIWLLLDPETGDIELSTKAAKIEISCRESGDIDIKTGSGMFTISATEESEIDAPQVTFTGNVVIRGNLRVLNENGGGPSQMTGGLNNIGGTVTSNTVTLETHNHTGVQTGSGNTGSPNAGT